jgi:hypothetical protein
MDVSDLRKILRALDDARKEEAAAGKCRSASAAYAQFLSDIAVPLFDRPRTCCEPSDIRSRQYAGRVGPSRVRHTSQDFVELELDTSVRPPRCWAARPWRGGKGLVVDERPLAPGRPFRN